MAPPSPSNVSLFPRPRRVLTSGGSWRLPARVAASGLGSRQQVSLSWLSGALRACGHVLERSPGASDADVIVIRRDPSELARRLAAQTEPPSHAIEQGYVLSLSSGGLSIVHGGEPGLQHALATLVQLIAGASGPPGALELPSIEIEDYPDFAQRGVMLDVSRDKVPTRQTLEALIDRLARWKINQLQLYMEHTFAYAAHPRVWRDASPLDAEEIRALDAFCEARHIELVPNQNSFGHMHRWLVHEPYRALAECPEGFVHPWNWKGEPYGLCATDPASLRLLEGLYDELLPNFRSRQLNVGLDETLDLGHGRSRAACAARGTERVYLDFLHAVHERVRQRGRVMQFWGDIIVKRPELVAELPRDAIALEWGYEADHPFAEHLALFQRAGLEFYVCPGTSSWNSIAGRTHNAILNLALAAREGDAAGARGVLTTDWGDHGHLQPLPVSYLGLLLGAGFSWNVADAADPLALDVPALLDRHAFYDGAGVLGRVAHDLGNAYRQTGSPRPNASVLFWILIRPDRLLSPPGVTRATLEQTLSYIEQSSASLARARPGVDAAAAEITPEAARAEGPRVIAELGWARDVLRFACRLGIARLDSPDHEQTSALPRPVRDSLAGELAELIERHRALWLDRNRPGGLVDSAGRLETLLATLVA
jgi:hypothetical protein